MVIGDDRSSPPGPYWTHKAHTGLMGPIWTLIIRPVWTLMIRVHTGPHEGTAVTAAPIELRFRHSDGKPVEDEEDEE